LITSRKLLYFVIVTFLSGFVFNSGFIGSISGASGFNIVATGDWGCTKNTEATVNNTKSKNPELLLALGDYSYQKTSACWLNIIKPLDSVTKINIGNHDDESDALLHEYLNHFGLSNQYYSYNIKDIHILTMSTEGTFSIGSKQFNFVVKDLETAATDPKIKWIIVNMHVPMYTSPNTCAERTCAGDKSLRDTYHTLFDKYGVDLVLEGHVHNYQRSYPIKYDQQDPSKPLATSSSKNNYNNPEGEIYAIVGTGGVNLHGLSGKSAFMASQQDSKFGVLDFHFNGDKLDAMFVSNDGKIMDQFSITKTKKKVIDTSIPVPISGNTKIVEPDKKNAKNNTSIKIVEPDKKNAKNNTSIKIVEPDKKPAKSKVKVKTKSPKLEQNMTNLDQTTGHKSKSKSDSKTITNKENVQQDSNLKAPEINRLEPPQIESEPPTKQKPTIEPKEQILTDPFAPINR
jgi:predicted MPP superfamily phosphohydrolase